ncbi:MAG: KpsF/GutQ family sugar-phosphate isomerase, partial [Candidatus Marinimicrobia bacterium]|nr:KpsF/GutQ family sugar-phosphate isomerase [Candidatus Neomarinimicrobiota bacterium]
ISKNDTVILISNSGETDKVVHLVPFLKKNAVPIIGLLGSTNSTLAKKCNIVLSTQVEKEADPLNMVPTASTVVTLAMGDALAIALMTKKEIDQNGFAAFHPGGSLGRRLLTTVEDLMHKSDQVPLVSAGDDVKQSLYIMTKKGFGIVGVLDKSENLIGVITDGDLRRMLEKRSNFLNKVAKDIMSKNPKWIESNCLAIDALHLMEEHAITNLFVYTKEKTGRPIGIIHIHDILRYGILS